MTPQRFDHLLSLVGPLISHQETNFRVQAFSFCNRIFKEMIKPLRHHSKVFVETFMMKTISFPELEHNSKH